MTLTDLTALIGIGSSIVLIVNYFFSNSFDKRFRDSIKSFNNELKGLSEVVRELNRTLDRLNMNFTNLEKTVNTHSSRIDENTRELQKLKNRVELYHHTKGGDTDD